MLAANATSNRLFANQLIKSKQTGTRPEWPLQQTGLTVQESRRNDRRNGRIRADPQPPAAAALIAAEYEYDDPFADVRAMGEAQFTRSHMINRDKKKNKRRPKSVHQEKVHRYPAEPASQESHPVRRYPDIGDETEQFGPADEFAEVDLTNISPQPSNDYADEADPEYEDDGYGDDDDDEDDSETRSRTFVASGTGHIPEDMRLEADDVPDIRETAADSFINDREKDADRSIDYYKQHEVEK
jgi:hypothetical protein